MIDFIIGHWLCVLSFCLALAALCLISFNQRTIKRLESQLSERDTMVRLMVEENERLKVEREHVARR